jgi:hypothetical protein
MPENKVRFRGYAEMLDDWLWYYISDDRYFIKNSEDLKAGLHVDLYSWSRCGGVKVGYAHTNKSGKYIIAWVNCAKYSTFATVFSSKKTPVYEVVS